MERYYCNDVLKAECWKEQELLKETVAKLSNCKVKFCLKFDMHSILKTTEGNSYCYKKSYYVPVQCILL